MPASVLYVDDDRSLCQIVARALAAEGHVVRTAHDGEAALVAIRQELPGLLLLDMVLPRRDGFEVLEALRATSGAAANLPVLLFSGATATDTTRARARKLGAADFLTKPVPLERLLELVSLHAGEVKLARGDSTRRRRSPRVLAGRLERVPLPAILHHLHGLRATGVLELRSGRKRKWVALRDGYPVGVRSNLRRETLGDFLERKGRITRAILEESLALLSRERRQGEILVAMDVLAEDEVPGVLIEQADAKFFEIFRWEKGTFHFERGAKLSRANAIGTGRSPAHLIISGVRAQFPIGRIDRYFEHQGARLVSHAGARFYRFQELRLEADEAAILHNLDGSRPLSDFAGEDEDFRRTIYGLIAAGLLELSPRVQVVPSGKRRAPQARAQSEQAPTAPSDARRDDPTQLELAKLAEQLRAKSHFEVLGVAQTADVDALREAYEALSARTHPDRYAGGSQAVRDLAAEVHGLVGKAYETLTDPRSRKLYMMSLRREHKAEERRRQGELALEAELDFRKGEAALKRHDYPTALARFGHALELYPGEGDHHAHYGWALYLSHPDEPQIVAEALEHVKRGLKLASHREKPYLFMGRLYKAVGRVDAAEKMFTRAVQIQPQCVEALRELRIINMRRERSKGLIGRLLRR